MESLSGIQRNIVKEILRECFPKKLTPNEHFVAFYVKLLLLDPNWGITDNYMNTRVNIQNFVKHFITELEQENLLLSTLQMQFSFRCYLETIPEHIENNRNELLKHLYLLKVDICKTPEPKDQNEIYLLNKKIVYYITLLTGLGSPTNSQKMNQELFERDENIGSNKDSDEFTTSKTTSNKLSTAETKDAVPILRKFKHRIETVYFQVHSHVLSAELQQFFVALTEGIFGYSENTRNECFRTIERDYNVAELTPFLAIFIKRTVEKNIVLSELPFLVYCMKMVKNLLNNKSVSLREHLHLILPAVLSCCVTRKVCKIYSDNHWTLRDFASYIVAEICKRYNSDITNITNRVIKVYLKPLEDPNNSPLTTIYGAIKGVNALGKNAIKKYLFPNIKNIGAIMLIAEESYGCFSEEKYNELLRELKHVRDAIIFIIAPILFEDQLFAPNYEAFDQYFGYMGKYIFTEVKNIERQEQKKSKTEESTVSLVISSRMKVPSANNSSEDSEDLIFRPKIKASKSVFPRQHVETSNGYSSVSHHGINASASINGSQSEFYFNAKSINTQGMLEGNNSNKEFLDTEQINYKCCNQTASSPKVKQEVDMPVQTDNYNDISCQNNNTQGSYLTSLTNSNAFATINSVPGYTFHSRQTYNSEHTSKESAIYSQQPPDHMNTSDIYPPFISSYGQTVPPYIKRRRTVNNSYDSYAPQMLSKKLAVERQINQGRGFFNNTKPHINPMVYQLFSGEDTPNVHFSVNQNEVPYLLPTVEEPKCQEPDSTVQVCQGIVRKILPGPPDQSPSDLKKHFEVGYVTGINSRQSGSIKHFDPNILPSTYLATDTLSKNIEEEELIWEKK